MRTYLYKLTSDRGGAPCAPEPAPGAPPLLTLAICKPAIRRTAQAGDRLFGVTSKALQKEGYPAASMIYAAEVAEAVDARDYYAAASSHRGRPDCIYLYDEPADTLTHTGATLHADPYHGPKDVGRHPLYRNGRVLLCTDFRYFGTAAVPVPLRFEALRHLAETTGEGHRVIDAKSSPALQREADLLFRTLLKRPTSHTPNDVADDSYDHRPRSR